MRVLADRWGAAYILGYESWFSLQAAGGDAGCRGWPSAESQMPVELYGLELPLSLPAIEDTSGTASLAVAQEDADCEKGCRLQARFELRCSYLASG